MQKIAGVDEAGRGPLAGPVVAAAVVLKPGGKVIEGLRDSKKLSEKKRELLFDIIQNEAYAWSVSEASVEEIDQLNILQASLLAMRRAIEGLPELPGMALIDGNKLPTGLACPAKAIIGGDDIEPAISAASILAKVTRDRMMVQFEQDYPGYEFLKHKGYPTKLHRERLIELGVTPIHRKSFAPVKNLIA